MVWKGSRGGQSRGCPKSVTGNRCGRCNGGGTKGCLGYGSVEHEAWIRRQGELDQSKQTFEVSSLRL